MRFKNRIVDILFWSVLSAAFIGPGTITTAASAGSGFGLTLLWALVFSTLACIVLQEAAARLSLVSGHDLGEAIRSRLDKSGWGRALANLVLGSVLLGCAAYEAGNILGAVAGARLLIDMPPAAWTLIIGVGATVLLWFGSTRFIAQVLGVFVALMGVCFLTTAIIDGPAFLSILKSSFIPRIPNGSGTLVIALIGTTVVPYNLFLGSGLKHTQTLSELRISLGMAVLLGGLISMAVLVTGTFIQGTFTYASLASALGGTLGSWAAGFFAFGLLGAGLSSALTAPLAAALTARSMMGRSGRESWDERDTPYRVVWGLVLLTGVVFGLLQVQPIPAIILAQALNGIILPLVAIFLLLMANDRSLLTSEHINGRLLNALTGVITFVTVLLGLTNLLKAASTILGSSFVNQRYILPASVAVAFLLAWPVMNTIRRYRKPLQTSSP